MSIRGVKPIMPKPGGKPTGIFSGSGKQKADSTSSAPEKVLMGYAKTVAGRVAPKPRNNMIKGV